jgi:hypothetical protein
MQFMPNNKQGSGQTNKDMDRMSQGQRGGYGNTRREAGGSQQNQNKEVNQGQQVRMGSPSSGHRSRGQGGNDDET